jgi:hypothetical protein
MHSSHYDDLRKSPKLTHAVSPTQNRPPVPGTEILSRLNFIAFRDKYEEMGKQDMKKNFRFDDIKVIGYDVVYVQVEKPNEKSKTEPSRNKKIK